MKRKRATVATTAEVAADLGPGARRIRRWRPGSTCGPRSRRDSSNPIKPGTLEYRLSPRRRARATTTSNHRQRVCITQNGRIAWQTQPGVAFLSAGQGTVDLRGAPGFCRRAALGDHAESDRRPRSRKAVGQDPGHASGEGASVDYTMTLLFIPRSPRVCFRPCR